MTTITVRGTTAVDDPAFGQWYPNVGDEMHLEKQGNNLKIAGLTGFQKLNKLDGEILTEAGGSYVSKWVKLGEDLEVQLVVSLQPPTLIYIWKRNGFIDSSGISTG